ncbi:unnamed protein product [Paramecium pentaurelia]|uniref:Uncharacterized protein n=1 Tax=Paramecium pentaurelia TaxID=43138 RepID=A0A8S1SWP7_9CILI|nr:unnamed protein product [Paramecium pentaurelia]
MMFMNGHGGYEYTKIQDTPYLLDFEMEKITKEMKFLKLYQVAFLISDSCGAITLFETVKAKNMILLGQSSLGEKAYSYDKFSITNHYWLKNELDKNQIQLYLIKQKNMIIHIIKLIQN